MKEVQIDRLAHDRPPAEGDIGEGTDGFFYLWLRNRWVMAHQMIDGFDFFGFPRRAK